MSANETPLPRRRRRDISSAEIPASARIQKATSALDDFLAYLRDIERLRQYHLVGRLSRAQILRPEGAKTLDFRKEGPVLAFANSTEQLIVCDPWRGLPPKWDDTDQFCTACLSKCDVCGGTGKKRCEAFKCGGSGKIMGTDKDCPVCAGSGEASCSLCHGTGKRPTGIKGGLTNYREPTCPECRGSKFAHKEIPQDVNSFVNARIGGMIALGPIVRFVVESVGGEGLPPQVYDVEADTNGQHLAILLESEQQGSRVYMIGGVLRGRTI
jgi:hypothetical protein